MLDDDPGNPIRFEVEFIADDKTTADEFVNIMCASQLISPVIMDLELDAFNLTNFTIIT
jgi:phosphoribosylformylglycinamidine (FGAM) synthase PurS component